MKVYHYINFILIFLLLVGICVAEDILVSNSLAEIQKQCYKIEKLVDEKENLKNTEVVLAVDNLEYMWHEDESNMCYLVNHKSIQEIGQEIARIKLYISEDNVNDFLAALDTIKFYCHSYLHFMGANMHNVL